MYMLVDLVRNICSVVCMCVSIKEKWKDEEDEASAKRLHFYKNCVRKK